MNGTNRGQDGVPPEAINKDDDYKPVTDTVDMKVVNQAVTEQPTDDNSPTNSDQTVSGDEGNTEQLLKLLKEPQTEEPSYLVETQSTTTDESSSEYVRKDSCKKPKREDLTLKDYKFKKQEENETKEKISPEIILNKHVLQKKGHVSLFPLTAIVSGIEKRRKTKTLVSFLNHAIRTDDDMKEMSLFDSQDQQCLSCYKTKILGTHPFGKLTWLKSTTELDSVTCMMSYFAKLCKGRDLSPQVDYYRLLEFAHVPTTSENTNISDPDVAEQMKRLYAELKNDWDYLKTNKAVQDVMDTGVCLINILDVGPCKAAQDLLPYINEYCKQTITFACYDSMRDTETLKEEFSKDTTQNYHSLKYQLMQQLLGINKDKEKMVVLTAIDDSEGDEQQEAELTRALGKAIGVDKVLHLRVSEKMMEETKKKIEMKVTAASFNADTPLSYMMLLDLMESKRQSFWMKRSEIESLSKKYNFQNEDLENFLRFFTSFGSILYTHDIPTLKEYVIIDIVKFVRSIHEIHHSSEETACYGLFKERKENESRIIFDYLTTLGIATELKSNQIIPPKNLPQLQMFKTYYFIPTARNIPKRDIAAKVPLFKLTGCTKRNRQAHLCNYLIQTRKCLFIPTDVANTIAFRFTIDDKDHDIEFIDEGNEIKTDEKSAKILKTCPFIKSNSVMEAQAFIDVCVPSRKKITFKEAKELARKISKEPQEKKITILSRLERKVESKEDWESPEAIMCMLLEFAESDGTQKLFSILTEHDISIRY